MLVKEDEGVQMREPETGWHEEPHLLANLDVARQHKEPQRDLLGLGHCWNERKKRTPKNID